MLPDTPLDFIHNVTTQIPDPRTHLVRYYGAYANRLRSRIASRRPSEDADDHQEHDATHEQKRPLASWARLLRKIMEVDPLLCPRCQVPLKIVSVITEPAVIDRILIHLNRRPDHDPFEPRGPPTS